MWKTDKAKRRKEKWEKKATKEKILYTKRWKKQALDNTILDDSHALN